MIEVTTAVRNSDNSFFHVDKNSSTIIKRLIPRSIEGEIQKWQAVVHQMLRHKLPCKVQLVVGWGHNEPILSELTFRPKE